MRDYAKNNLALCIITGIFPPDIGGPATYVSRLAHSLHQQGHKLCVITLGNDTTAYPFPVKRVSRSLPLPVRLVLLFLTLIYHGWRSDVWYINGLELPAVLAGKLLRKRLIMKVVGDYAWERALNARLTRDGIDDFQQQQQHWKVELHKKLRAWLARQAKFIITPGCYLKNLVCGWGVLEERVRVIYNAVEEMPRDLGTNVDIRKQLGLAENDQVIMTSGRLVPWKGIDQLIRVVARLDQQITLLIVGAGPEKKNLSDVAETLKVTDRVKFLGKVDRNQVLSYLKASNIFVLNTRYEGFSHVLLEALMVGTPVITTPVCGNPELITHNLNGMLVECNNPEALAQQIAGLLCDTALQSQLIKEGKTALQRYSWERLLQETIRVINGVMLVL